MLQGRHGRHKTRLQMTRPGRASRLYSIIYLAMHLLAITYVPKILEGAISIAHPLLFMTALLEFGISTYSYTQVSRHEQKLTHSEHHAFKYLGYRPLGDLFYRATRCRRLLMNNMLFDNCRLVFIHDGKLRCHGSFSIGTV